MFALFAKKKLVGEALDYLDHDFFQVVKDSKGKKWIQDIGYIFADEDGFTFVGNSSLWMDPKRIRSEGYQYYQAQRDDNVRSYVQMDSEQAEDSLRKLATGAKYLDMKSVTNETSCGMYFMNMGSMMEDEMHQSQALYDSYGYSDEADEDTIAYLDDVRMDEVESSKIYAANGKVANRLMSEKMWEEQKMYADYAKKPELPANEQMIIEHLRNHRFKRDGYTGIYEATQKGMADALSINRNTLSRTLNSMTKRKLIAFEELHVNGSKGRVRCYYLVQ